MKKDKEKERELIYSAGAPYENWFNDDIGESLRTFKRTTGVEASNSDVIWSYFLWLTKSAGLNGPDPNQEYRKAETDDKTYFMLALKLFKTEFKPAVTNDVNRVIDARILREDFALVGSRFQNYEAIDFPGASFLEVMIMLCQKFDTQIMMTTEKCEDRWVDWFWLMLKNCNLDIYTDAGFNYETDDNLDVERENPDVIIDSVLKIINERSYKYDGTGGFFPLKNPQNDQRKVELWFQMHAYFLENLIE